LVREYRYLFTWSYEEFKSYYPSILKHVIPIIEGSIPFQQKQRYLNPKVEPSIQRELEKLYEAQIIESFMYSNWVANCVPVRKTTGEIRVSID